MLVVVVYLLCIDCLSVVNCIVYLFASPDGRFRWATYPTWHLPDCVTYYSTLSIYLSIYLDQGGGRWGEGETWREGRRERGREG